MSSHAMRDQRWGEARAEFERLFELSPIEREVELAALTERDAELGRWVGELLRQDDEVEARLARMIRERSSQCVPFGS